MNNGQKADSGEIERLVRASQAGDRGAFDELVRLYQGCAMQAAVRILGSADAAADAVQNGFVKAYLNIRKLREYHRFEIWLMRIMTNTAITYARTVIRRAGKIKTADNFYKNNDVFQSKDKLVVEELKDAIRKAMGKLSKKEAEAISLFGLDDLSNAEVAEIMDCSVEAVRWYVFRARGKLKVLLKDYL